MHSLLLAACVLLSVAAVSQAQANSCSSFINDVCRQTSTLSSANLERDLSHCSAQYEGFPEMQGKIRQYIVDHLTSNFQFMLMKTNFGNHQANRPGFEKLYEKLSDQAWEDAVDLVKYNAKRGGYLTDFKAGREALAMKYLVAEQKKHAMTEYTSLGYAMDITKRLAAGAHDIHKNAIRLGNTYHDPEISSFIEKEFAHKHADTIRMLSGHMSDMNGIMAAYKDFSLSLYFFDEYLLKSLA